MAHYRDQILREPLGRDFFTIETLFLKTIYVLFFVELGSRRVHFAGCTTNPHGAWVAQQARQLAWSLDEIDVRFRFLFHDRDTKFTDSFDTIFRSEGRKPFLTLVQAPNANSHAERWIRSARSECLNKIIIVNEAHLRSTLTEYVEFYTDERPCQGLMQKMNAAYNNDRPHQGIGQQSPIIWLPEEGEGLVQRRPVLGGIINDYYRMAA